MKAPDRTTTTPRGSALLVVLWALIILTGVIFAWAKLVEQEIQIHGYASQALEARAMAHSGVTVALHPKVKKQTPLLEGTFGPNLFYRARLISEGGKINLNWIAAGEKDPRRVTLLKQWLEQRGLNFQDREHFVDCLLDYIDADDLRRLNGAEDQGDYHPANQPLRSIDEVAAVMGSDPLVSTPGWKDQLTLDSTGPIDILAATAEVLRFIPGFSEARIQRLVQLRQGPDGIDGTADDPIFQNLQQVLTSIGFAPAEIQGLNGFVMINDPVVRIISAGQAGKVIRQVEVVARKGGSTPLILSWKE